MIARLSKLQQHKLVLGLLGLALFGGLTMAALTSWHRVGQQQAITATPKHIQAPATPVATPSSSPALAPGEAQQPQRLVIPKLAVDAAVEKVGVDTQGNIGIPSDPNDAAWYRLGPLPGDPGNAIIDGHLDWTSGPAVFSHLGQLQPKDQVTVVRRDGSRLNFLVTRRRVFRASQRPPADMWVRGGPSRISLITCTGPWDAGRRQYQERLVVDAQAA